ncbi:MAG: allantoinase AllB [Candidatus Acidiferrales bacterium]
MSAPDLIIRGNRVVTGDASGEPAPAAIHIQHGVIAAVTKFNDVPGDSPIHEAGDLIVMPGIVDTHVHINEPGRTGWEGFTTATRAAAAGGVTTLIEMPLNSIPATTTASAFREKLASAAGKLWVDTGFWGGVIPGNAEELLTLWNDGVFGFKCFLVPSGVDEFPQALETDLRAALPILAEMGAPLLVHAELPGPIDAAAKSLTKAPAAKYSTWLASRPREAENEAIALMVNLAKEIKARIHIVHVSSSDALPILKEAKSAGLAVTAETCPHYLAFSSEEIPDGATEFKCAPPIRESANREKLWEALADGTLDFVATDHSPCPPEMKRKDTGDFIAAWGGIASLELSLPAVWTSALERGYAVERLAGWLCSGPARLAGLETRKGKIAKDFDADLVIWDPNAKFRVEPERLHQRNKLTPYAGRELHGVVAATYLRGRKVFERGEFAAGPSGYILKRTQA